MKLARIAVMQYCNLVNSFILLCLLLCNYLSATTNCHTFKLADNELAVALELSFILLSFIICELTIDTTVAIMQLKECLEFANCCCQHGDRQEVGWSHWVHAWSLHI